MIRHRHVIEVTGCGYRVQIRTDEGEARFSFQGDGKPGVKPSQIPELKAFVNDLLQAIDMIDEKPKFDDQSELNR